MAYELQLVVLAHAALGGIAGILTIWALVEALNISETNLKRLQYAAIGIAVFVWLAYIVGGWFYIYHYGPDKELIKQGAWAWAHGFYMETKEHVFFASLLMSTYLPILTYRLPITENKYAQYLVIGTIILIILTGLYIEFAGGVIAQGIRVGAGIGIK